MTSKPKTNRLDAVVATSASISRERAQSLIMAGKVMVNGSPVTKAGASVPDDARIEITDDTRFVSRGGEKLEKALDAFEWPVIGLRCLDVGASTGGFTDCLLQRGAASVTAVDVGYGQLAWSLQSDPRVTVVDRTNFRIADVRELGAPFDFITIDVSFISLTKLADQLRASASDSARLVALIKPQFEAGRAAVGRGGVVRDASEHAKAIESVMAAFESVGLAPARLTFSPITGPAGNIEFLIGAVIAGGGRADGGVLARDLDVAGVVAAAHETLVR
ncbi:MAG TPA: TlyA family RNA methyltransferase [Candidatus Eremiobacteraceae bacterium]|nr:TlyA family RNA methyltransferase [Candidatus Eremiobacteraceae bacterium]